MFCSLFQKKIDKIDGFCKENNADGALFSRCDNFSWITYGGRSHITLNTVEGEAKILVIDGEIHLFANNIEMKRLLTEEIPDVINDKFIIHEYNWWSYDNDLDSFLKGKKILSDSYCNKTIYSEGLNKLRLKLDEIEIDTFRKLGIICDRILYETAHELNPEMTELDVHGILFNKLVSENIEPVLALVFSDISRNEYRHNLSRNIKLGKRIFFSICARKKGLILSATRSLLFVSDTTLKSQYEKNCYVDAVAIKKTRPGNKLNSIFENIQEAYQEVGFKGEWMKHHQGGLAGFAAREITATPSTCHIIEEGNSIAWNPTITGTKSEDTAVVLKNDNEIISYPKNSRWPELIINIEDEKIRRPALLLI